MPVGPDATTGEDSDNEDDDQFVGGFIDLGNQERPEVEQLRQEAAEVAVDVLEWRQGRQRTSSTILVETPLGKGRKNR